MKIARFVSGTVRSTTIAANLMKENPLRIATWTERERAAKLAAKSANLNVPTVLTNGSANSGCRREERRGFEMIGSDFVKRVETRMVRCSECGKKILSGETSLVSMKRGKVAKRVCSEECRMVFDDAFWQEVARGREKGIPIATEGL